MESYCEQLYWHYHCNISDRQIRNKVMTIDVIRVFDVAGELVRHRQFCLVNSSLGNIIFDHCSCFHVFNH